MEHIRRVLEQVMAGQQVGKGLWDSAMAECAAAEAQSKLVVGGVQDPAITLHDKTVQCLGEMFFNLEDFVQDMYKLGVVDQLRTDVVNSMLDCKDLLKRLHYEPVRTRPPGPITGSRSRRAR